MSRPTKIIIDTQAIKHNCHLTTIIAPQSKVVAMVKADAYGHGTAEVAKILAPQVAKFGVCCLEEAQLLRDAGINKPIVLIEGCFEEHEYHLAAKLDCEIVVHNEQQLSQLLALEQIFAFTVWLKIDSGMHRLGISLEQSAEVFAQLQTSTKVAKIILTSHFSNADELDSPFTLEQISRFERNIAPLLQLQTKPVEISLANSAAILGWPKSHYDWVRPGIMLYGISPFAGAEHNADKLRPAMQFCSKVIALRTIQAGETVGYGNTWQADRTSIIATVAAGYGDGYPRTAPSGTPVLVNTHRAKLVGRVSMDMLSVDVTELPHVAVGDEVELWGARLLVNEVAQYAGTNGYELVTRMPSRAARSYQ